MIIRTVIFVIGLFFFSCVRAVAFWTAGPGLLSPDQSVDFITMERRIGQTTIKYPYYVGGDRRFKKILDETIKKEEKYYTQALQKAEKKSRLVGWTTWQQGFSENGWSLVLVKSLMYEGAVHPLIYIKGLSWDSSGKRLAFNDLKDHVKDLTIERLRTAVAVYVQKKGIVTYSNYHVDEFPKEFYIGSDRMVYFIFQEYDIAPYASGWITVPIGRYE